MQTLFLRLSRTLLWMIPVVAYFAFAPVTLAAYISPSGSVYPGASYSVNETVTNSGSSAITVHNDWFYKVNGGGWNSWCSQDNTISANSSRTVSCGSTGDVAGTAMEFQVNTWWNPWTVTWSNTGFTVQARPIASVSISGPSSAIAYNTSASLSVSSTNAMSCSVSGGGSWSSVDAQATSGIWNTGTLTSNTTFTVNCNPTNGATNRPVTASAPRYL